MTIAALSLPMILSAQSAVDAYNLSQSEQRGTARFMAMGGAFTALGGDLSALNQNPAGIGIYRRSEIGLTLDVSPRSITSTTSTKTINKRETKLNCNNFGYVGTVQLDGAMRTFSWGASFNRVASFDRVYSVYNGTASSSLTDYIAYFTEGTSPDVLGFDNDYNPYWDSDADWLSILTYNSYLINPNGADSYKYKGLYGNGTVGDALSMVRESGYIDEYAIDFGGNIEDVVYWGAGFGITDLSYRQDSNYSESLANPYVDGEQVDARNYDLYNSRVITGSGWNFKAGVILKPVNELRIGLAIHTPTWYTLSQSSYADIYNPDESRMSETRPDPYVEYTENAYYNFKLNTPWKLMAGVAAVIGNSAIVSFDYERQAYNDMSLKYQDSWYDYVSADNENDDIKNYYKSTNILRLGAEYRVTPRFSVRAGYNYTSSNVKQEADNGSMQIFTAGMNPSYVMHKDANAVSFGLGYRYQQFYIDGVYVYRNRKSTYHAYTDVPGMIIAPKAELSEKTHSIVLSLGFKF